MATHWSCDADLWGLIRNLILDFVSNLLLGTLLINRINRGMRPHQFRTGEPATSSLGSGRSIVK